MKTTTTCQTNGPKGVRRFGLLRILAAVVTVGGLLAAGPEPFFGQTVQQAQEALTTEPGSQVRLVELALAQRREGNLAAALLSLEEALGMAPRCPTALQLQGEILLDLGRYEAAGEVFRLRQSVAPASPDAWYGLIRLQGALLNWEAVVVLCNELLTRFPDNSFGVLNLAWAKYQLRNYAEAARLYDHPVFGKTKTMRSGKGWSLLKMGNAEAAREIFRDLGKEFPTDSGAIAGLREAETALLKKDYPGWLLSTTLTAAEVQSFLELASRSVYLGKYTEALDLWGYVLRSEPGNASACLGLADSYAALGSWSLASYYYSVALNRSPELPALRGKVRALGALGLWDDAASFSAEILARVPGDMLALSTIAYFRYTLGEFGRAYELYEKAGRDDPLMILGRAWCKFMLKEYEASRVLFKTVLEKQPANAGALEGLRLVEKVSGAK